MPSNSYMADYMLKRYHERRKEAIESLGGKCIKCGSVENLEIDHIDPKTKSFNFSKIWSFSPEKYSKELEKCQILCKDCHMKKSREKGSFNKSPMIISKGLKHGTVHGYSKYK